MRGNDGASSVAGSTTGATLICVADENRRRCRRANGIAETVVEELRRRGHEPLAHGALAEGERDDWAWASEAAGRDVADGRAEQAVVCCWTGTGASIAANKVPGVRAALCVDAATADGPALYWRLNEADDRANVEHLAEVETGG